jgi:hypothetical protein
MPNTVSYNPMTRISTADQDRSIIAKPTQPDVLTRFNGGHRRFNHPYVSGFWYFIVNFPERLFNHKNGASSLGGVAQKWFLTTAESFTPPSRNLTKVDVPGMGGMASSYIAGQEISRTFTVAFREFQEMPIMNILQIWTSVIDPNTGVSPLSGSEYIPANYKGSAFAALCKPTIGDRASQTTGSIKKEDIEELFFFDGVFPESAPWDSFSSDISTNDTTQVSVTFSFDGFPLLKNTPGVVDQFLKLTTEFYVGDTYSHYIDDITQGVSAGSRIIST